MASPRILTLDIESAPNLAHVWSLWNANVSLNQLMQPTSVMSFAAKWHGKSPVEFRSDFHDGHEEMIERAWALLDEADVLVTYNGKKFDVTHLQREFILLGLTPPSPYKHVDLYQVVRAKFNFASRKLDHVVQQLGLGQKVKHEGHDLWVRCLAGDPAAWGRMKRYNKADVVITERLYDYLTPWINGPHMGLLSGVEGDSCKCGSVNLEKRGTAFTSVSAFQQYRCRDCGAWPRGSKALGRTTTRGQ